MQPVTGGAAVPKSQQFRSVTLQQAQGADEGFVKPASKLARLTWQSAWDIPGHCSNPGT